MNIRLNKAARTRVLKLKIASLLYWLVFMGSVWALAFALTGSMFRAFLATFAFGLAVVAYGQFRNNAQSARIVEMLPLIRDFDEEMNGTGRIIRKAGEKLKGGDSVYIDPTTGEVKKTK